MKLFGLLNHPLDNFTSRPHFSREISKTSKENQPIVFSNNKP
ncbi:hypothetical protein HMPREF1513_0424 [Streptococcus sp. BS29a]|nr:hypothetical protein HMPREF1513_0424 [Streptococcus sp. BS29a]